MAILPPNGHSKRNTRSKAWRGGRVVECTALEMRHTGNRIGGSNPSLSASDLPRHRSLTFDKPNIGADFPTE
jgi:hypothetical protein